ncbi:hypothetical protein AND_010599, partial [Anopheles darlingi]
MSAGNRWDGSLPVFVPDLRGCINLQHKMRQCSSGAAKPTKTPNPSQVSHFSDSGPQRQSLFGAGPQRSPFSTASNSNFDEDIQQIVTDYKQKYGGHGNAVPPGLPFYATTVPPSLLSAAQVEVANLKVRIPQNHQWVVVDRCQFIEHNRTLDTKLEFPDLQISGRVIMHPSGGRCDMILRLRRAGIEFRTIPFCEGPTGIKYRINSKRRHFLNRQPTGSSYYGHDRRRSLDYVDDDLMSNDGKGDILKLNDGDSLFLSPSTLVDIEGDRGDLEQESSSEFDPHSRTFFAERNPYSYSSYGAPNGNAGYGYAVTPPTPDKGWQNVETNEALDDAYSNEIDNLFSKG